MAEPSARFWEVFFDVYAALPRQGPGSRECTARALGLCRDLPHVPAVLDLGCGVGAQTIHLAELTAGNIVAVDNHAPWIDSLGRAVSERGLGHRIQPTVGDMTDLPFAAGSFDLIWSEGALYNIGIEPALRICRALLGSRGHVAFTDAVWRKADPPAPVRASFDFDYPTMGTADDLVKLFEPCGFELLGRFSIPDQAWWDDFYTPMVARVAELRPQHAGDAEALAALDLIGDEPELHRQYSSYYAYEFFVARRQD